MIAVDTSALAAIFLKEPDAEHFAAALWGTPGALVSTATLLELTIVLATRNNEAAAENSRQIDEFVESAALAVEQVTEEQARIARLAYLRYGKGMGHPAQLNFGDCFSYALAKAMDVPLLYKGSDFSKTDIVSAL